MSDLYRNLNTDPTDERRERLRRLSHGARHSWAHRLLQRLLRLDSPGRMSATPEDFGYTTRAATTAARHKETNDERKNERKNEQTTLD